MFLVKPVLAQCPVCIVTVGGGMFLAKKLGIDDFIISVWISALNTAIAFWLAPKFKLRILNNPLIFSIILYALTLFYFIYSGQTGSPSNQLLGIDKIILGQTLGLIVMVFGIFIDRFSRTKNNGKILFQYQKVVFPLGSLLIFTLLFKLIFNL